MLTRKYNQTNENAYAISSQNLKILNHKSYLNRRTNNKVWANWNASRFSRHSVVSITDATSIATTENLSRTVL